MMILNCLLVLLSLIVISSLVPRSEALLIEKSNPKEENGKLPEMSDKAVKSTAGEMKIPLPPGIPGIPFPFPLPNYLPPLPNFPPFPNNVPLPPFPFPLSPNPIPFFTPPAP
ncbi:hypothetical protein P3X46_007242 [Hevea brasiliensis]|uniref:Uncharacterized protein n=1 Tax=Hevea brasiliensis TaxID=3981 RepID=A0ABQ9MVJ9_HEVBR|nr:hypothetical protein P3X46_007242 [Hevea brasiliensis]